MINNKEQLRVYLEEDRKHYFPRATKGGAINWWRHMHVTPISIETIQRKYLKYLRYAEFAINTHKRILQLFYLWKLRKYAYKTRFQIPPNVLGPCVTFFHWGTIIIHGSARIGKNATFQPNVVIGKNRKEGGAPQIGDNFYACSGTRIYGDIQIGNNVRIGPNCCVYNSIPDNCVVVGNPAIIVKKDNVKMYDSC